MINGGKQSANRADQFELVSQYGSLAYACTHASYVTYRPPRPSSREFRKSVLTGILTRTPFFAFLPDGFFQINSSVQILTFSTPLPNRPSE